MAEFCLCTIETFDVEVIYPHATNDSLSLTLFAFQPDRLVATEETKQKIPSKTKKLVLDPIFRFQWSNEEGKCDAVLSLGKIWSSSSSQFLHSHRQLWRDGRHCNESSDKKGYLWNTHSHQNWKLTSLSTICWRRTINFYQGDWLQVEKKNC